MTRVSLAVIPLSSATILILLALGGCGKHSTSGSSDKLQSPIMATVVAYEADAQWDHYEDGSFATYDMLTLKLDSPVNPGVGTLQIAVSPTDLPEDSPFRSPGTRMTFTLDDSISPDAKLAWGALEDPTVAE